MYTLLRSLGAEVLLVPSAFTVPTGAAHWEVLLRARAIETQSFVLAAAQVYLCWKKGKKKEKRGSQKDRDRPEGIVSERDDC
jgi:predicted amidohydrolase